MDERGGRRRLTGDGDERRMGGRDDEGMTAVYRRCQLRDVLVERLTEVSL
jgi:hypothetical protein